MEVVLKVSSDPEWETTLCNTFKASAVCRCNALAFSTPTPVANFILVQCLLNICWGIVWHWATFVYNSIWYCSGKKIALWKSTVYSRLSPCILRAMQKVNQWVDTTVSTIDDCFIKNNHRNTKVFTRSF